MNNNNNIIHPYGYAAMVAEQQMILDDIMGSTRRDGDLDEDEDSDGDDDSDSLPDLEEPIQWNASKQNYDYAPITATAASSTYNGGGVTVAASSATDDAGKDKGGKAKEIVKEEDRHRKENKKRGRKGSSDENDKDTSTTDNDDGEEDEQEQEEEISDGEIVPDRLIYDYLLRNDPGLFSHNDNHYDNYNIFDDDDDYDDQYSFWNDGGFRSSGFCFGGFGGLGRGGVSSLLQRPTLWNPNVDGNILDAFLKASFTLKERQIHNILLSTEVSSASEQQQHKENEQSRTDDGGEGGSKYNLISNLERLINMKSPTSIGTTPRSPAEQGEEETAEGGANDNDSIQCRATVARIVAAYCSEQAGAVILKNHRHTKYQAIEFFGPMKQNPIGDSDGVILPCVELEYGIDPMSHDNGTGDDARLFLRDEVTVEIQVSNPIAVVVESHILKHSKNRGNIDVMSGLVIYEGYLQPILPPEHTLSDGEDEDDAASNQVSPSSYTTIDSSMNFGLELELTCASGNYKPLIAKALQDQIGEKVGNYEGTSKSKSPSSALDLFLSSPFAVRDVEGRSIHDGSSKNDPFWSPYNSKDSSYRKNNNNNTWKLVYDKSIKASDTSPQSQTFELVSPILCGEDGITKYKFVFDTLTDVTSLQVNQSMGLHVHVDVSQLSLEELKNVCYNFIAYEDVIDENIMPKYRRTGSIESRRYFRSNKHSMDEYYISNNNSDTSPVDDDKDDVHMIQRCQNRILSCQTYDELYDVMNPPISMNKSNSARYYKLNLQNLKCGRQPTIEFRQHPSTTNVNRIEAWIRFCILFVSHSCSTTEQQTEDGTTTTTTTKKKNGTTTTTTTPSSDSSSSSSALFEILFESIIQDPALYQFYMNRKKTKE